MPRWVSKQFKNNRDARFAEGRRPCPLCWSEMWSPRWGDANGSHCREATVDHINPTVAGGTHRLDNLRIICRDCNDFKGNL
jgi:5-methylcytosine-specific restriction endonuclease McrA